MELPSIVVSCAAAYSQSMEKADLQRAARKLIEAHGNQAEKVAEKRAQNIGVEHDASAHTWRKIAEVVREIRRGSL
jgi:hypothetical protein